MLVETRRTTSSPGRRAPASGDVDPGEIAAGPDGDGGEGRSALRGSRRTRLVGTALDQVLATGSNILITLFVAKRFSAETFGAFSLAYAAYVILLGVSRALILEPLLVRHAHRIGARGDAVLGAVVCATLGFALCLALALAVAAALGPAAYAGPLAMIALMVPALLTQDAYRVAALASGAPARACLVDGAWLVAAVVLVPATAWAGGEDVRWPVAAWGAASLVGTVVGAAAWRAPTRFHAPWAWVRSNLDLGARYLVETLTSTGMSQGLTFVMSFFGGALAVGAFQGALSAMAPVSFLVATLMLFAVPEAVTLARHAPGRLPWIAASVTAVAFALPMLWLVASRAVPPALGHAVFGESWTGIEDMLPAVALYTSLSALIIGPTVALRAVADARATVKMRVILAPLVLCLAVAGAAWSSPRGGVVLGACGLVLVAPYAQLLLARATPTQRPGAQP